MKKMLCLFLALIMCASLFAACGGEKEKSSGPVYNFIDEPDISGIPLDEFTVVANGVTHGSTFAATVDEEQRHIYGEWVNICDDTGSLRFGDVCLGDRLKIVPKSIEATTPITIHTEEFEILYHNDQYSYITQSGNPAVRNEGLGCEAFSIIPHKEMELLGEMPSYEEIHDLSFDYDFVDIRGTYTFRVFDIKDGVYYLNIAEFQQSYVYSVLIDPQISLKVGDFVRVKFSCYYNRSGGGRVFHSENITDMKLLTENEIWKLYVDINLHSNMTVDKPVIYLYPEEDTECSVKVTLQNGKLTCTYPEHGENGWQNFTATPDGTLIFPDGKQYYCLYWEGKCDLEPDFTKGACVKGSETVAFLEKALSEMGLSEREANEFIIYWLPILQENPYNLISFQTEAYTSVAELDITPTPDSLLRVYMTAKALDHYEEIEPQVFDGFERKGFTVVEWGGSIIE